MRRVDDSRLRIRSLGLITNARSARPVSNEAFRCIRAASSPADSGPYVCWWTQGVSKARPPACRAGALPLSYVSVVVMGGFDPPPRAFQARALPTELHDPGAGPGARTRINWVTNPVPIPLGPAGTAGPMLIMPHHPAALLHRFPRGAADDARARQGYSRRQPRHVVVLRRRAVLENDESQPIVSHGMHLLSVGSGGRFRTPISRTKTLRPAIGRLPSGDCWRGQWVLPPLLVGGSHACICQHLDPVEQ